MVRFAASFPEPQIVSTLSTQLSWCNFLEIIALERIVERDDYGEIWRIERSRVRTPRDEGPGRSSAEPQTSL
ncbi:MAG: hypothetical protein WKF75_12415 [Singulisphaera sp.]